MKKTAMLLLLSAGSLLLVFGFQNCIEKNEDDDDNQGPPQQETTLYLESFNIAMSCMYSQTGQCSPSATDHPVFIKIVDNCTDENVIYQATNTVATVCGGSDSSTWGCETSINENSGWSDSSGAETRLEAGIYSYYYHQDIDSSGEVPNTPDVECCAEGVSLEDGSILDLNGNCVPLDSDSDGDGIPDSSEVPGCELNPRC